MRHFNPRTCLSLLLLILLSMPTNTASALDSGLFDELGNLVRIPFDLDIPVTRQVVVEESTRLLFVYHTEYGFRQTFEHYRDKYERRVELGPGWHLAGYGFEAVSSAWVFTLRHAGQTYRFEVHDDQESGNARVVVRSTAHSVNYRRYIYAIAPFRAVDLGALPVMHP